MTSKTELFPVDKPIAAYNEFRSQLKALAKENDSLTFDLDTAKGQKECRSHIYKLRQTKTGVDKVRQAEKKAALEYGRLVDGEAREIVAEIDTMIQVHDKPLQEAVERERLRIEALDEAFKELEIRLSPGGCTSNEARAEIARLESLTVSEELQAHTRWLPVAAQQPGHHARRCMDSLADETLRSSIIFAGRALRDAIDLEEKEAELQAQREELEALRREKEEREQEDRIREREAAAAAQAKIDAEEAAQREIERKERLAQVAADQAKRQAREREQELEARNKRLEQEAKEAAAKAAQELADKQAAEKAEAKRRAENKRIATRVINAASKALWEGAGLDKDQAREVIGLIVDGKVPNVSIKF